MVGQHPRHPVPHCGAYSQRRTARLIGQGAARGKAIRMMKNDELEVGVVSTSHEKGEPGTHKDGALDLKKNSWLTAAAGAW